MVTMQMVFLHNEPGIFSLPKEQRKSAHEKHEAFLEKLWQDGRAVLVGPFDQSQDESYAELILLNAKNEVEAKDWLENDPIIKARILTADILPWMFENVFRKAPIYMDTEKIWFGILTRPKNAPQYSAAKLEELQNGHLANITKMATDGILASAGPFLTKDDRRGIFFIFLKGFEANQTGGCGRPPHSGKEA